MILQHFVTAVTCLCLGRSSLLVGAFSSLPAAPSSSYYYLIGKSSSGRRHGVQLDGSAMDENGSSYSSSSMMMVDSPRRSFLQQSVSMALPMSMILALPPEEAQGSGGATAGGAYLLSAKQRYNERVKASVIGLLQATDALKGGDTKIAKGYFESEDAGSWKDLTAAGYLLSNAFRRNSTAGPDTLPSVKKFKAFAAEVESLRKTLKKKGGAAASDQAASVESALNTWLSEIELPTAREL